MEIENKEKYISQYNEIKEKYDGKSVEEIHSAFANDITNDDDEYIDTNYKDILVTFSIKDRKCYLTKMIECYDENDNFIGTIYNNGTAFA